MGKTPILYSEIHIKVVVVVVVVVVLAILVVLVEVITNLDFIVV